MTYIFLSNRISGRPGHRPVPIHMDAFAGGVRQEERGGRVSNGRQQRAAEGGRAGGWDSHIYLH